MNSYMSPQFGWFTRYGGISCHSATETPLWPMTARAGSQRVVNLCHTTLAYCSSQIPWQSVLIQRGSLLVVVNCRDTLVALLQSVVLVPLDRQTGKQLRSRKAWNGDVSSPDARDPAWLWIPTSLACNRPIGSLTLGLVALC